jgi:Cof subfamily protein (haloacid dehalogenase superfamily)
MSRFSGSCRALFIDVDGTSLNSAKELTAGVRAAVVEARRTGMSVCFATGRMFEAVAHWVADLGLTAPQVANNGAYVIDPADGRRLLNRRLTPASVAWLLDQGEARGFVPVAFAGHRVLATARTADHELIARNNEFVEVVPAAVLRAPDLGVEKVLYLSVSRAHELPAVRDALNAALPGPTAVRFAAQITEHGFLNLCDPDATKLQAAAWVCAFLGCRLDDAIAVGDGDNDVDLLAGVGLGIAMGNASPAARAAAALAVPDNNHDGLAVAIRDFVLPAAAGRPTR